MHPDENRALISSIEKELHEEQRHLLIWKNQIEERIDAIQKLLDSLKLTHPSKINETEILRSNSTETNLSQKDEEKIPIKDETEEEQPDYHKVDKTKQKTPPRNFRDKLTLWKSMEGMKTPEKSHSMPNFNSNNQLKRRSVVISPKPQTYPTTNDDLHVISSLAQIGEPCVRGVSFRFLKEFIDSVPLTYTTTDVVLKVIIPKTKMSKCAYVQAIETQFIGKPTFYVSHRWESKFHFLFNLLKSFMEQHKDVHEEGDTFFWIDIFALNQHREEPIDDIIQVEKTISSSKSTLFCLDEEGLALTRTWCLFEIWKSVTMETPKLVVLMSGHSWQLHELFLFFDLDQSETSVSNDKIRLLKEMTSQSNSQQTTSLIKNSILQSSLQHATSKRSLESLFTCSILHRSAGHFDVAEDKARQAFGMAPNSPDAQSLLVHILLATGKFKESHLISEELLKTRIDQYGIEHPAVAVSMNNLAQSLHCMGNYQQAELYSVGSLKMNQKLLGLEHPDTVASMEILAFALSCQGKHEESESIYQRLLNIRKVQFGNLHLTVASSTAYLASSMKTQGKFAEAEQLYQEVLHIRMKLLGSEHPHVIYTMLNLSQCLQHQEKFTEAQSLFQSATEMRKKILQSSSYDSNQEYKRITEGTIVEHFIENAFGSEQEISWDNFEAALKLYAKASQGDCSGVKFCLVNKEGKVPLGLWKKFVSWFRPLSLPNEWTSGVGLPFQFVPNGFTIHEVASIVEPDYFFGLMSAQDSRTFLRTQPNGSFLIRFSGSQVGSYTLSAKHFDEVSHWAFDYVKSDISYFAIREQPDMYPSLGRLVNAFSRQAGGALYFKDDTRPRYLEHPINKNALMQSAPTNKTVYAEFIPDSNLNLSRELEHKK